VALVTPAGTPPWAADAQPAPLVVADPGAVVVVTGAEVVVASRPIVELDASDPLSSLHAPAADSPTASTSASAFRVVVAVRRSMRAAYAPAMAEHLRVDPAAEGTVLPPDTPGQRRRLVVLAVVAALLVGAVWAKGQLWPGRPGSPPGAWTVRPYEGLGAWVDVYDWTDELGGPKPTVDEDDIDAMADAGVQTVFLQVGHDRSGSDVMETDRLDDLIDQAHRRHLHVVAWYLPTYTDLAKDLRRIEAADELRVDGLAIDIEATDIVDVAARTQAVVELGHRIRASLGERRFVSAITLSPTHLEVVNPAYWPGYPWQEIGATYDAVLPMAYWSIRKGDLRNGERYIADSIDRTRADLQNPTIPIHAIGGIADGTTVADLSGMVAAVEARRPDAVVGGSLYDWATSNPAQWHALRALRELRR
jgi:hypothetical protein